MAPLRPGWLASTGTGLAELVLPGGCAGCGAVGQRLCRGVCDRCAARVAALSPHPTRPDPAPAGLPWCAALGDYAGVLQELVVGYKDRGRHRLARPLGRLLARVVGFALDRVAPGQPSPDGSGPVVLVPVPDTPAAARARHGDHLWRLARPAVASLQAVGVPVTLARPLRARPRPDSAGLDTAGRAAAASAALALRPLAVARLRRAVPGPVILLDDVVTTGATLAVAAARLAGAGIPVTAAAVLAATRRTSARTPDG